MMIRKRFTTALLTAIVASGWAQDSVRITVDGNKPGNAVAPTLHGVFFEEISHGGEGGLYAEMIQNRGFEEADIPPGMKLEGGFIVPPRTPHFSMPHNGISDWKMEWPLTSAYPAWSAHVSGTASVQLGVTTDHPLNNATPHSLQVSVSSADAHNEAAVENEGFWGMNVVDGDGYLLKFYVRGPKYTGHIIARLRGQDNRILAEYVFDAVKSGARVVDDKDKAGTAAGGVSKGRQQGAAPAAGWKEYQTKLKAKGSDPKAHLELAFDRPGVVWLDFVSLFPEKTFHNRPNGLRQDLAEYIAELKPAFIRWPGGCFVEGITIQSAPDWKETIGPVEKRTGTYSPWGYWTSNGFGYHEYLQYCEDIGAAALYVFNAGVSCDFRSGTFIADDSLQPYIQNALDAIEYAIGPVTGKWGKLRAAAGHPAPFPLKYVEVGNEQSGPRYAERYNRFYDAIKTKYPQIQLMASMGIGDVNEYTLRGMKKVDFADEHAYKGAGWAMTHFDHFDRYKRGNWNLYVGEYATNGGVGSGNLEASLSDAVYIMGMEKNGDLVKMSSYAPLLVNTNDIDWPVNLINFDDSRSFARISYYTIKLFNENRADLNWATSTVVAQPAVKKPAFAGGIGLSTWDTRTEYKDIEVIQDGKTIFSSDFVHGLDNWSMPRGHWEVRDSALAQTAGGAQRLAYLKGRTFDRYTLKLKARKLDGYNAFIIPFAMKDSNTMYRVHIGAWVNRVSMFEKVTGGFDVSNISSPVNLKDTIAAGRWYDIRLEVGLDSVSCYLDGKLLISYKEPERLFAIAGRQDSTGDVIVKVVNAYDHPMSTEILLQGAGDVRSGQLTTLTAPSLTDENSFERPRAFVPRTSPIGVDDQRVKVKLEPNSINVIRVKKE